MDIYLYFFFVDHQNIYFNFLFSRSAKSIFICLGRSFDFPRTTRSSSTSPSYHPPPEKANSIDQKCKRRFIFRAGNELMYLFSSVSSANLLVALIEHISSTGVNAFEVSRKRSKKSMVAAGNEPSVAKQRLLQLLQYVT